MSVSNSVAPSFAFAACFTGCQQVRRRQSAHTTTQQQKNGSGGEAFASSFASPAAAVAEVMNQQQQRQRLQQEERNASSSTTPAATPAAVAAAAAAAAVTAKEEQEEEAFAVSISVSSVLSRVSAPTHWLGGGVQWHSLTSQSNDLAKLFGRSMRRFYLSLISVNIEVGYLVS